MDWWFIFSLMWVCFWIFIIGYKIGLARARHKVERKLYGTSMLTTLDPYGGLHDPNMRITRSAEPPVKE